MWQRLLRFLDKTKNPLRPDAFVIQTAEKWATADKLAGRVVLIMGDFNRSAASLEEWSSVSGLSSWSTPLARSKIGSTFATFNYCMPDLPQDVGALEAFAQTLDLRIESILPGSPPLEILTPEQAGRLQGEIIQASVKLAAELSPPKHKTRMRKGSRYKDGFSPEYLLLRAALHAYTDISRLLWRHLHRAGRPDHHETELSLIMGRWYKVYDTHPEALTHPHRLLFPSHKTLATFRWERIMDKICHLKKFLHSRHRKRMRMAMSERIQNKEALLVAQKFGKLIEKLLPDYSDLFDFTSSRAEMVLSYRARRQLIKLLPLP
jgi:hypothetical protein